MMTEHEVETWKQYRGREVEAVKEMRLAYFKHIATMAPTLGDAAVLIDVDRSWLLRMTDEVGFTWPDGRKARVAQMKVVPEVPTRRFSASRRAIEAALVARGKL